MKKLLLAFLVSIEYLYFSTKQKQNIVSVLQYYIFHWTGTKHLHKHQRVERAKDWKKKIKHNMYIFCIFHSKVMLCIHLLYHFKQKKTENKKKLLLIIFYGKAEAQEMMVLKSTSWYCRKIVGCYFLYSFHHHFTVKFYVNCWCLLMFRLVEMPLNEWLGKCSSKSER